MKKVVMALDKSIEHWQEIYDRLKKKDTITLKYGDLMWDSGGRVNLGTSGCALCSLYYLDGCYKCPLHKMGNCCVDSKSTYKQFINKRNSRNALRMLNTLKSLREKYNG